MMSNVGWVCAWAIFKIVWAFSLGVDGREKISIIKLGFTLMFLSRRRVFFCVRRHDAAADAKDTLC